MITMAIDASSKSTGIAIFKDKELAYYECIVNYLNLLDLKQLDIIFLIYYEEVLFT